MICDNCGHFNDEFAKFCVKCAYPLVKNDEEEKDKNEPCIVDDDINDNNAEENNTEVNEKEVAEETEVSEETEESSDFTCYSCGKKIDKDLTFCRFCGVRLKGEENPKKEEPVLKEEIKKDTPNNLIPYIVALIVTMVICTGAIISIIIASNLLKNDKYGIEEKDAVVVETKEPEEEKEEESDYIIEEEEEEKEEVNNLYNYPEYQYEKITASSFLPDKMGLKYSPDMTVDNMQDTAWNEGTDGDGIGEWIEFSSKKKQYITGINILNGYCKSETLYYENHRPKTIEIKFDGMSVDMELDDLYNVYQNIEFAEPVESRRVRIIVKDIYRGTGYDDCCISEIGIY